MVTRFISLFSPICQAPWKLAYLHTTALCSSGDKSEGPEVVDIDMDRQYDDDLHDDNLDKGSDKLAPIDIDGYAEDEETHAKKLFRLPKIPEKRSGIYVFEGIKIMLPQRMLRPEFFRYRYTERELKLADDIRICAYDPVTPSPRWSVSLPAERMTTDPMVMVTSNLQKVHHDILLNNKDPKYLKRVLASVPVNFNPEGIFLEYNKKSTENYANKETSPAVGSLSPNTAPGEQRPDLLDKASLNIIEKNEKGDCAGHRKNVSHTSMETIVVSPAENTKNGVNETPVKSMKRAEEVIQKFLTDVKSK